MREKKKKSLSNLIPVEKSIFKKRLPKIAMLLVAIFFSTVSMYSQAARVTLDLKNVTVKQLLKEIELQTGYTFVYNDNSINAGRTLSVKAQNEDVKALISRVITDCDYSINAKSIILKPKEKRESAPPVRPQGKRITGVVTDTHSETLIGVTIVVKGVSGGTITDIDGNFAISVPPGDQTLVFSYVGMKTKEVVVADNTVAPLNITMQTTDTELGEVVVTGIFNKPKESYTGAATMITAKELAEVGNHSVLTSIRNVDPSFNIAQDLTIGSDPNALPSITLRGTSSISTDIKDLREDTKNLRTANQPLFILNGFEISLTRFADMDESQIESITLLKDASAAAMYGSRGANGVVVITTKKPASGRLIVTYRNSLNIEAPDLTSYNLMNAREKLAFEKASGLYEANSAIDKLSLDDLYNKRKIDAERGVDTYWLKYPVRVGIGQRHSLRAEGGDKIFSYAINAAYKNTMGTMKGSERNTFDGGLFLSYNFKNLTFQNDLQITNNKANNSPYGSFEQYTKINSYFSPYDDEGNLKKVLENFVYMKYNIDARRSYVTNPLYDAFLPQRDESRYQEIYEKFALEWHIIPKELFVRGRFNLTNQTNRSDRYISAKDTSFDNYTGSDYERKGRYTYGTGNNSSYEIDLTLNYSKTFLQKHQLFAGLEYDLGETTSESYTIIAEGISNVNMDFLGMASKYLKDSSPSGTEGITRRIGLVGSADYIYDHRYYVNLSARTEGSSRFGGNKRFAPFYSSGIGWNLHRESFLADNYFLNFARLKASYGISGTQNFNPYQAMTTFKDYEGLSYRGWYGVYLAGMGNTDLAWQQTNELNLGTELEMLDRRIHLNFDVYNRVTDNLVIDINLPTSSGFTAYKANLGKVVNNGAEISLNAFPVRNKRRNITWSVGGSLRYNKNEIQKISNSLEALNKQSREKEDLINPSFMLEEGQSINTIYAVKSKGIDPSNGLEIFVKRDGTETYTWNANDLTACGVSDPKIWGNLNTYLYYKGVTLNIIFGYRYGGQIYNNTLVNKVENIYPYSNADKRAYYDRWKEPGDKVFFKSVTDFSTTNVTSRFVMDDNTMECRTLSLGYEIPVVWLKKHSPFEFISITGYAQNPFIISSIKQERGTNYPFARTFSTSLTVRF